MAGAGFALVAARGRNSNARICAPLAPRKWTSETVTPSPVWIGIARQEAVLHRLRLHLMKEPVDAEELRLEERLEGGGAVRAVVAVEAGSAEARAVDAVAVGAAAGIA